MTHEQILDDCLQKPGTFTDYPFGFMTPVVKVGMLHGKNRIIAQLLTLHGEPKVTLSCAPEAAADFRSRYPGSVVRGWHCPPVQQPHFNTVSLDGTVPDDELRHMIDHAYAVALGKLPQETQVLLRRTAEALSPPAAVDEERP